MSVCVFVFCVFFVWCLLINGYWLWFARCCLLFGVCRVPFAAQCALSADGRVLCIGCSCSSCAVYGSLLFAGRCVLLFVDGCCVLFVVLCCV